VDIKDQVSVMVVSERSASSLGTVAGHAEHVYSVAEGARPPPGMEEVSSSWQRSANNYGVDPVDSKAPRILTTGELKHFREPLDQLIFAAQEEIDQLYKVVREAGYTLLFCDSSGVAVEHRGEDAQANRFKYWGTWLGGVWSEELEGTNGIGTCIVEERPVTVHRSQHFRSRHIDLSCSGAPVFGIDGRLTAVLDVSAIDPELSERAHALTGALTVRSARAIEERFFRQHFRREWILAVAPPEGGVQSMLLAIDSNQRIVGANRVARKSLLLDDRGLRAGISLWTIFERDLDLFRRKDQADIFTQFVVAGGNDSRPALVTPPDHTVGASSNPTSFNVHTRPRLDSFNTLLKLAPPAQAHGGLSAGAMRRVREYVEAHLGESIDLAMLAAVAGLSLHHFARQFKQSAGITPHHYLTQKRVQRAQEMLVHTALSLSEIAYATGFSDQSHLSRHFRQLLGTTPREFRWSQR
jgi:transcriptional regulator of acetoin/glycerol metabolism/AraC-like DNA-binding protein